VEIGSTVSYLLNYVISRFRIAKEKSTRRWWVRGMPMSEGKGTSHQRVAVRESLGTGASSQPWVSFLEGGTEPKRGRKSSARSGKREKKV